MKIGLLAGSLMGGGAERTILTLAKGFYERGHEVHLFLLKAVYDYDPDMIEKIHILEGKHFPEQAASLQAMMASETEPFDLFVTSKCQFSGHAVARNVYCSVHITPSAWVRSSRWNVWRTYRKHSKLRKQYRGKRVIALSEGIKDDLLRVLKVNPASIDVINNPFDFEEIRASAEAPLSNPPKPYILYIASMIPRKRHDVLLHAFAKMRHREVSLVLLGKGDLEDEIRGTAQKLGVADRVIFGGWDANPYRWIKNAEVSLLASDAEGLPRVVVESLIVGTPVVSTDCPSGPNEVLIGDLSRFLVPRRDPAAFAEAVDLALDQPPVIDADMIRRFSHLDVADRYVQLIRT